MRSFPVVISALSLSLLACTEAEQIPDLKTSNGGSYSVTATDPVPAKKPFFSPEFRKGVLSAMSLGYVPVSPDTFELIPENEFFSLVNPAGIFTEQQMIYFKQGESVRVRLKGACEIAMEERTLLSTQDLDIIISAMSRKLKDPQEERYMKRPFSYWQFKSAICHIYTTEEKNRKHMDTVYELWIGFQTPVE